MGSVASVVMSDMDASLAHLDEVRAAALAKAERWMLRSDFCPYLDLKTLLCDCDPDARKCFCALFTRFYGLNTGGLTDAFKKRYFEMLFGDQVMLNGQPDYAGILNELSAIERRQGDCAMPFCFVSKLVAMCDESRPIYDKHVLAFFGRALPAASTEKATRIEWYVSFLAYVGQSYRAWAQEPLVAAILERLKGP